jgi:hypothetical protein
MLQLLSVQHQYLQCMRAWCYSQQTADLPALEEEEEGRKGQPRIRIVVVLINQCVPK